MPLRLVFTSNMFLKPLSEFASRFCRGKTEQNLAPRRSDQFPAQAPNLSRKMGFDTPHFRHSLRRNSLNLAQPGIDYRN